MIFALFVLATTPTTSAISGTKLLLKKLFKNLNRASGYHVDMHDGLLNCFLTFEKFESETFIEAISRKKYANPCRPFIKPTASSTTTTTTTQPAMFLWSGWSEWERSTEKKKTHIRQRFCMNGRNFVETGTVRHLTR